MIYLFIHQNFPGQYRHLAHYLASKQENDVYFITQSKSRWLPGVTKLVYDLAPNSNNDNDLLWEMDVAVRRGLAVLKVCQKLKSQGIRPDIIVGHNGWGETLFVKDEFFDVPLLSYFEFFYHPIGLDVGFDKTQPPTLASNCRIRIKNTINLLGLEAADWGNTPTRWQLSLYPPEHRKRISVLHEGVNTRVAAPDQNAFILLKRQNLSFSREDEIITYVARNLEPYRGISRVYACGCDSVEASSKGPYHHCWW